MRRPVRWSQDALDDLEAIVAYISIDDPDAADIVVDRIERAGEKLGEFASGHPGRISGFYEKRVPRTRYILAYAIERKPSLELIVILHVIHSSRDWREGEWPE